MLHYFAQTFPFICLERMSDGTGVVRRTDGWRNTIFLRHDMVESVDRAMGQTRQTPGENVTLLFLATFYHELSHCLWGHLNPTKLYSPEKLAYLVSNIAGQGESGYVVEASLFGGVLSQVWEPDVVPSYSNISQMVVRRNLGIPGKPWIALSEYSPFSHNQDARLSNICIFTGSGYVTRLLNDFLRLKYILGPLPVKNGGLTLCFREAPQTEWGLQIQTIPEPPHTVICTPIGWLPFSVSNQVFSSRYRSSSCSCRS